MRYDVRRICRSWIDSRYVSMWSCRAWGLRPRCTRSRRHRLPWCRKRWGWIRAWGWHWENLKNNTGVVNDPFGQPTVNIYFALKVGMDGRTLPAKTVGRPSASTRQESSMIHSASPQSVWQWRFVFFRLIMKSGDVHTYGQHVWKQWLLPAVTMGRPCGSKKEKYIHIKGLAKCHFPPKIHQSAYVSNNSFAPPCP